MNNPATCDDCGAHLSRYRKRRETICAPCDKRRTQTSLTYANTPQRHIPRSGESFVLRWRGYEWDTISTILKYPSPQAASAAALDYARRNDMTLP
jgi:hypothetical protein